MGLVTSKSHDNNCHRYLVFMRCYEVLSSAQMQKLRKFDKQFPKKRVDNLKTIKYMGFSPMQRIKTFEFNKISRSIKFYAFYCIDSMHFIAYLIFVGQWFIFNIIWNFRPLQCQCWYISIKTTSVSSGLHIKYNELLFKI